MSKKGTGLLLAGFGALFLMGGKKKKKKKGSDLDGDGYYDGDGLLDPDGRLPDGSSGSGSKGKGGSGGKKSDGSYNVPDLAPDAIWISDDCQRVYFAEGRIGEKNAGDEWFYKKAIPAIRRFADANYTDPYEIARSMILAMAPCSAEFPVQADGVSQFELQAGRDSFMDSYRDVYMLIMLLVEAAQSSMGQDGDMISFNSNCDVTHVGNRWEENALMPMVRFYVDQISNSLGIQKGDLAYSDVRDVVPRIVERFNPACGEKLSALSTQKARDSFLKSRPGLDAAIKRVDSAIFDYMYK